MTGNRNAVKHRLALPTDKYEVLVHSDLAEPVIEDRLIHED